ncbi:MAG TPA: aminomethyl-transferring glycine dehydrogenase subunit GcvPA [Acidimicrobiales bacterium]|nr:aminomethyl-transferring glycine dehydrogenase subunit GcvPA [Acidimicrobiales bacterium]
MPDFVPHTREDMDRMLKFLGLNSTDELFASIPAAIRLAGGLDLESGLSEADVAVELATIGAANLATGTGGTGLVCFAGGGAYDHEVPAVTRALAGRSEFVTAYTPYQPEVAQGVLEALFEYQTFISRISGLPISNSSLYDGSAALVEAVNLAVAETGSSRVLVSTGIHPRWRSVLATFAKGTGHQIEAVRLIDGVTDWASVTGNQAGCVVVGYPNYVGAIESLASARSLADRLGALLVVCQDPVSAGLLKSPGTGGADVVVGEAQAFGTSLSFGGPYLGFLACAERLVRRLPGRLVGETVDLTGKRSYVTTLRAREQDIRRERASSNVCTNETLMAVTAAIQLGWLGTAGIREIAIAGARAANYARKRFAEIPEIQFATAAPMFREFTLRLPIAASETIDLLLEEGYLAGIALKEGYEGTDLEETLLLAFTERRTKEEIDHFVAAVRKVAVR